VVSPETSLILDTEESRRNNESVPERPDYRADPSPSPEGHGQARDAWEHYHLTLASHEVGEAYGIAPATSAADLDPVARDDLLSALVEESELLGFWLAWRRAGGFAHLEYAGWNRATIFRRIRRFRTTFGVHPDDYRPDWITLDLHKVWGQRIDQRLAHADEPDDVQA
jgi:hypothetical protein